MLAVVSTPNPRPNQTDTTFTYWLRHSTALLSAVSEPLIENIELVINLLNIFLTQYRTTEEQKHPHRSRFAKRYRILFRLSIRPRNGKGEEGKGGHQTQILEV